MYFYILLAKLQLLSSYLVCIVHTIFIYIYKLHCFGSILFYPAKVGKIANVRTQVDLTLLYLGRFPSPSRAHLSYGYSLGIVMS